MESLFKINNEKGGRVANVKSEYLFVEVGGLKIQIKAEYEGVVFDVYDPNESDEPVASAHAFYAE